jgi:hypothetical protein
MHLNFTYYGGPTLVMVVAPDRDKKVNSVKLQLQFSAGTEFGNRKLFLQMFFPCLTIST